MPPRWQATALREGDIIRRIGLAVVLLALSGSLGFAGAEPARIPDETELLALTDDMKRFVALHVEPRAGPDLKLRQLIGAIVDSGTFGIEYDGLTRTAFETFVSRRGNCLSFATMFIAMARHAGLTVAYQEVEVPPDWTLSHDSFVLNQHINVYVDLGLKGKQVVDFNMADFRSTYEMRTISDARAAAHFYSNLGVERMQAGDRESALACFHRAIAADRRYAPAWTNLGTLHLRNGDRPAAEFAYHQALRTRPSDLVAMSNLARFYELTGDERRAAVYHRRVARHRHLNPYYRYRLALTAFSAGQYDDAIGHLKYAIRRKRNDDRFHVLLALSQERLASKGSGPEGPLR